MEGTLYIENDCKIINLNQVSSITALFFCDSLEGIRFCFVDDQIFYYVEPVRIHKVEIFNGDATEVYEVDITPSDGERIDSRFYQLVVQTLFNETLLEKHISLKEIVAKTIDHMAYQKCKHPDKEYLLWYKIKKCEKRVR